MENPDLGRIEKAVAVSIQQQCQSRDVVLQQLAEVTSRVDQLQESLTRVQEIIEQGFESVDILMSRLAIQGQGSADASRITPSIPLDPATAISARPAKTLSGVGSNLMALAQIVVKGFEELRQPFGAVASGLDFLIQQQNQLFVKLHGIEASVAAPPSYSVQPIVDDPEATQPFHADDVEDKSMSDHEVFDEVADAMAALASADGVMSNAESSEKP